MKRKMILNLSFLTVFLTILWSCHSEDFVQQENADRLSAKNVSTAKFVSRSLWKEDVLYIDKVQQVFLKHANLERFNATYGELNWSYAMSYGQFGEKYALVPITKKNKVVLLMEAVRIGSKVYFYEKKDENLQTFFEQVMYSNIVGFEEKINTQANPSAKGLSYMCSTRTIYVGCANGEANCPPVSHTTMVCEWVFTINPPKGLPPSGDPNLGSGGNDGYEYPDPPEETTPCEKTKNILEKPTVQKIINDVKTQALNTLSNTNLGELGFKEKKDGTVAPADINASHKVVYNDVTDGYGGYHNHTANGTHMFSPPDIADTLLGFAAAQDNVGDAYFGMIAAEWCNCPPSNKKILHYVIQYTGAAEDIGTGGSYNFTQAQVTQFENDYRKTVRNLKNTYINGNNYIQTSGELNKKGLEKLFFEMLNTMGLTGKVILQKVEANGTINNITLDNNNMPTGTPCP